MPNYLVESYHARERDLGGLVARAGRAAEALAREGKDVRYLRTSFLPGDEVCLHWFAAPSPALVHEAAHLAALRCDRIVETIDREMTHRP